MCCQRASLVRAGRFVLCCLIALPLLGSGCGHAAPSTEPFSVSISLDLEKDGIPVNRMILGNNTQWVDRGDEILEGKSGQFSPEMLTKVLELQPTVLRYPGGCQADTYHWKNGVGTLSDRKPNPRFFDKRKEEVLFGTAEFLELCRRTGAEALVTVNLASGTAEEAAQWVELVNVTRLKSPEGELLPKVKYWEIGNEPYLTNDKRPELAMPPQEVAKRINQFIAKIKEVDPTIEVLVPLRSDQIGGKPATPYQGYADKVLAGLTEEIEHVAVHNAYLPAAFGGTPKVDELFSATLAGSRVVAADMETTRGLLQKHRSGKKTGIAVTEHSALFTIGRATDGYIASHLGALYLADLLMLFAQQPDISLANYWSMTGNWYFGAVSNDGKLRPSYHVLKAFAESLRGELVPVAVTSPTFANPAVGYIPAMKGTPLVAALASRQENRIVLFLLNKDRYRPARTTISASDAAPAKVSSAETLATDDPFQIPTEDATGWRTLKVSETFPISLDLPPHSLSRVELELEQ